MPTKKKSKFFTRIIRNWFFNSNSDKAAAITFYTLFSFPPLLFLSLNLATLIFNKDNVEKIMLEWMEDFTGPEVIIAIKDIFSNSANFHLTNSIISFLIIFYSSAKIFTELNAALNRIYKDKVKVETEKGKFITFIEKQIMSLILVSLTCLLIFVTLIINFTLNKLGLELGLSDIAFLHTLNNISSSIILGGIFLALYKFLPKRKIKWVSALVGTTVGIILFEIGKYIIALYLSLSMIIDFYGSMGSLVILMFWVYYTVQILLIGAECAIEFETTLSSKTKC